MTSTAHPSFPSTLGTNVQPTLNGSNKPNDNLARTKILVLGLRRSGKTSIQQVLFNNLPPNQTFYLETTMRTVKNTFDTVIPLEIWDCPGNVTVETLGAPLSRFSSLIFVIDIRDLHNQAISRLVEFIIAAYHEHPNINLEVFVHKTEKIQDDDKIENFRQIHERVTDQLLDTSAEYEQIPLNFYLTSVYDHSLHEAFSRVLQKLIDSLPYLEELLNVFCANSQSPKAFLFDIRSRLYIATDASPVDSATHNLCCDYLQMLNSFGPLYRSTSASSSRRRQAPETSSDMTSSTSSIRPGAVQNASSIKSSTPDHTHTSVPDSTPKPPPKGHAKELFYPSAATSLHPSTPGTTLTYHLITPNLALLALIPTAIFQTRRGLLEYNVVFFREGVQEICDVEQEARGEIQS